MDSINSIKSLFERYVLDEELKQIHFDDLDHGELEIAFSDLCAVLRIEKIPLTPTDKQLIDEIGEFLWNGNIYHRGCMRTKYWLELVDKPPYDNDNDPRRLIVFTNTTCGYVISEYNRKNFVEIKQPDNWHRTKLPLAEDTIQLLEAGIPRSYDAILTLLKRDLPPTEFEVLR
jgi:hypothetical protein